MTKEEFKIFPKSNKREVDNAVKNFEKHSKEFDNKLKKIFSAL